MRERVLLEYASRRNIPVYHTDHNDTRLCRSMSLDLGGGRAAIGISDDPAMTEAERTTRLGHELGHCVTGAFYSRHTKVDCRRREEARAEQWAITALLPVARLRAAAAQGVTEPWAIAETFGVTEAFVRRAIDYYCSRGIA